MQPREMSQFVPAACGEVWAFVRSAGLLKPSRHVALYLDAHGSVEVGVEVSEHFVGNDRVHCSRLPSGRVATAVHFGPYQRLSEAHTKIRQWCAEHGHLLTGVSWEIYGHWEESWNTNPSKYAPMLFTYYKTKDNHALTRPSRHCGNPRPPWAGSLNLDQRRVATSHLPK